MIYVLVGIVGSVGIDCGLDWTWGPGRGGFFLLTFLGWM